MVGGHDRRDINGGEDRHARDVLDVRCGQAPARLPDQDNPIRLRTASADQGPEGEVTRASDHRHGDGPLLRSGELLDAPGVHDGEGEDRHRRCDRSGSLASLGASQHDAPGGC